MREAFGWIAAVACGLAFGAIGTMCVAFIARAEPHFPTAANAWCAERGRPEPFVIAGLTECQRCHEPFTFNKTQVFQPDFDQGDIANQTNDWSWFCPLIEPPPPPPWVEPRYIVR